MTTILAIDPGTTQSAWVMLTQGVPTIDAFDIESNEAVCEYLRADPLGPCGIVVIERIEPRYGLDMGWETILTCEWVGRFTEAAAPVPVVLLRRSAILAHLSVSVKRADPGVRAAVMDRWGGSQSVRKGNPLHGIRTHLWSALGAGVAYREGLRPAPQPWQAP